MRSPGSNAWLGVGVGVRVRVGVGLAARLER